MRALGAALLICVGLTASASARTEFGVYGANGDAGNTDECPAGQYMMGVEARTGAWFDQIAVVCGALKGDGSLARTQTLAKRGGAGGGPAESVCGANEAVSQLRAWRTDGYQIRSVELTCMNIFTGATHVINVRGTQTSPDAHSPPHACKLPERATGLVIRHGKHVNGLALVCDRRLAPAAPTYSIAPGSTDQKVTLEGTPLQLFTFRPGCSNPNLLIVFHGVNRNAGDYRDWAIPIANTLCLIVVTPLFDAARFPDWAYAKGGIVNKGAVQPQAQWTGRYVKAIASWVQSVENRPITYSIIGHSAGAQFGSRTAAFVPTAARRIVVANPGSHVFPIVPSLFSTTVLTFPGLPNQVLDDAKNAPYGFGGVYPRSQEDEQLKRYLAAPVTIFLGDADTGSDLLDQSPPAMAQGKTRIERGKNAFATGKAVAEKHGWPFNWRLVVLTGTGHSAKAMFASPDAIKALQP